MLAWSDPGSVPGGGSISLIVGSVHLVEIFLKNFASHLMPASMLSPFFRWIWSWVVLRFSLISCCSLEAPEVCCTILPSLCRKAAFFNFRDVPWMRFKSLSLLRISHLSFSQFLVTVAPFMSCHASSLKRWESSGCAAMKSSVLPAYNLTFRFDGTAVGG